VSTIAVLIADDQPLFREGLAMILSVLPGIRVAGEARNGEEAIAKADELLPDVVLMDLRMPVMDGVAAITRLKERKPELGVIALTTFDDRETLLSALRAGAAGFLVKDVDKETLRTAIEAVARGESFLQSSVTSKVIGELTRTARIAPFDPAAIPLSAREREILILLSSGASNKEIGSTLNLAEGTVKNHVTNVLTKLGVRDRTQAAVRARELGLL